MSKEEIYDPLNEYIYVFRDKFKSVAERTFSELAAEADVDVVSNRLTCKKLYEAERQLDSVKSRISGTITACVLLWIAVAGGVAAAIILFNTLAPNRFFVICMVVLVSLWLLLYKVHPKIKELKRVRRRVETEINVRKNEAWAQMEPLNRLYDWDILTRMMSETVPKLEFDPYFTTQRLDELSDVYGWDKSFNDERSVLFSHSGLINGNPFVFCRTRKMEMGSKTYSGSKTITWTTRERGSDGKYYTEHHSQTLTAYVTADFPEYFEKTRLIYGNTAAPDLIFYRKQSGLARDNDSVRFNFRKRRLRRKARKLSNLDYAMMTNEEFEVAFDTSNRNSNQQFALLFTPLAQENMLKLLKDYEAGYGDDFDFEKNLKINTIVSDHIQEFDLDLDPIHYHNFDYDKAEKVFYELNSQYFRAIYFCFAPLLCVPMYQQIRSHQDIYGINMRRSSAFWEHESLANFWGQDHFKAPSCVTNCILKTEQRNHIGDNSTIKVYAHGYRTRQRVTYVTKFGGDGRSHKIPVYWDEYLPVTGTGTMSIKEDNDFDDKNISPSQRISHINSLLRDEYFDIYRRHIASKIG